MTKTEIDRLGNRLREGALIESDLILLDEYRRSFGEAYQTVVGRIRQELALEPTGRPAKSSTSIVEKLHRESVRLTQIQDIAGCRLIVADIAEQERVVGALSALFDEPTVVDRRQHPSHGYRAVHVIARLEGKLIEIQVRTSLQHLWAELSEKFSDVVDPAIKYGGGDEETRGFLSETSALIADAEFFEPQLTDLLAQPSSGDAPSEDGALAIADLQEKLSSFKRRMAQLLADRISTLSGEGRT